MSSDEPNVDDLAERLQAAIGDQYKVERPLGAGGFAVVYLVRDLSLKRSLAVKVLSPDLITSKTVLERFRREAETVAQLSHPNIVPLHFIGQKDDLLYLAMACIDGGSVADRLEKEGPLPVADVARIISEVASALAHAHKRGVIHRDIKPQNVLTDAESGRSLVTDFGIARTTDSSLTATGMFVGTPAYLAPEQVTGEPSDHRADIYALGVMGYEILGGRPPFDGPTPTAVLMKRLAGPPEPIANVRKDTPPELAAVIDACLAPEPEDRFQSAGDIVAALGGDLTRTPTLPGRKTVKRPDAKGAKASWKTMALAGAVLAIITAVVLAGVMKHGATPATANANADSSMVAIAGGNFTVGSGSGLVNVPAAHVATLTPFMLDRTEVTVGAYSDYVTQTKGVAPWPDAQAPSAQLPVTRVSWPEATSYCAWRHVGGRLPSEDEWEAAARGASGRAYPWGDAFGSNNANTVEAGRGQPVAVGSYPGGKTPEGVVDMIGNVWEWTSSPMVGYPGATAMPEYRVIRGGASNTPAANATAWFRGYSMPTTSRGDLSFTGFRCAKSTK